MANPIEQLEEFRVLLIQRRRQIVETALSSQTNTKAAQGVPAPGNGSQAGEQFLALQLQIDAVDRAVEDEEARFRSANYSKLL